MAALSVGLARQVARVEHMLVESWLTDELTPDEVTELEANGEKLNAEDLEQAALNSFRSERFYESFGRVNTRPF